MKKSIFANLPNELIIKILNDRKEIKKNERYKNNYNNFVDDFTERIKQFKREEKTENLCECLCNTFDIEAGTLVEDYEYDDNDIIHRNIYYEYISHNFNGEFSLWCFDVDNELEYLGPSKYRNKLNSLRWYDY